MTDNQGETGSAVPKKRRMVLSLDKLNLIIAVSAVLISAASFVATYMQSDAAYRQVKAETWPFLQVEIGNFDVEKNESLLYAKLKNAGVGPANVKSFQLFYDGQHVRDFWGFATACCSDKDRRETMADYYRHGASGPIITSQGAGYILGSGESRILFTVGKTEKNTEFWTKLDSARWKLSAKGCYCSLLGECYETDFIQEPKEVKACKGTPDLDFKG